jgi:hypothetical protein
VAEKQPTDAGMAVIRRRANSFMHRLLAYGFLAWPVELILLLAARR